MQSGPNKLRLAILVVAIAIGVQLRIQGLTTTPLFGDEHHTLKSAVTAPGAIDHFDKLGSHVLVPLIAHWIRTLIGPEAWLLRLVAPVPGILSLCLLYPIGRRLVGETPAVIATGLLAISPMHIYYSSFARPYALALLLGLTLIHCLARSLDDDAARARWRVGAAVSAILMLYAHLSTAGLVGIVALTYLAVSWAKERTFRALVIATIPFAVALIVSILLYLPVVEQVQEFMNKEHVQDVRGPVHWFELPMLLGGGAVAGWVLLIAAPLGLLWLARSQPRKAALMAAATLGPLVALYVSRPYGMGYAYSRYLFTGLPFALLASSWLLERATREKQLVALGAGGLLATLAHFAGPLAPRHADTTQWPKTYLAMHRLPAFQEKWHDVSAIYHEIANDDSIKRVIEAPLLRSRTALLYRHHQRIHGKRVLCGVEDLGLGEYLIGPYVRIDRPRAIKRSGAEVLIYHKAPGKELLRYWNFVFDEALPRVGAGSFGTGLMERHGSIFYNNKEAAPPPTDMLGAPHYEDEDVMVWRLRRG